MRFMNLVPALALVTVSAFAQQGRGALLTYSAGQAAINGQPVARNAGQTTVGVGQMISTGSGSAELSLTPGAMLRLDSATSVKVVALDEKHTEVQINAGRAEINLSGMRQDGELQVDTPNGVQTLLIQNGLYEFDTRAAQLRVFDGKAAVSASPSANQWTDVKAGRQIALTATAGKPTDFDRNQGDTFAHRYDGESARGGGYGYGGPAYGYAARDYDAPYGYGYGYPYGYGLYEPFAYGFYPGFYGGFGYGFGYGGGFGYGRGFGYGGGFGGRGFRR